MHAARSAPSHTSPSTHYAPYGRRDSPPPCHRKRDQALRRAIEGQASTGHSEPGCGQGARHPRPLLLVDPALAAALAFPPVRSAHGYVAHPLTPHPTGRLLLSHATVRSGAISMCVVSSIGRRSPPSSSPSTARSSNPRGRCARMPTTTTASASLSHAPLPVHAAEAVRVEVRQAARGGRLPGVSRAALRAGDVDRVDEHGALSRCRQRGGMRPSSVADHERPSA